MQSDIVNFYELYSFTKMRIASARVSARSGRKDEGRDVLRFIRGARIIEILKRVDFGSFGIPSVDISHLEWQLSELEQECHPSTVCDQSTDIAAIRHTLDLLAFGMQTLLARKNGS